MSNKIELANWLTHDIIATTQQLVTPKPNKDKIEQCSFIFKINEFMIIHPNQKIKWYLEYFNFTKYFILNYTNKADFTYVILKFKEEYINEIYDIITTYKLMKRD